MSQPVDPHNLSQPGRTGYAVRADLRDTIAAPDKVSSKEYLVVLKLLERIAASLDEMNAAIRPRARQALAKTDREHLAVLIPAIHSSMLDACFLARELIEHAAVDAPLRSALAAAGGRNGSGMTRSLGRLLARAEGIVFAGLVVQRVGPLRGGMLWAIKRGGPSQ